MIHIHFRRWCDNYFYRLCFVSLYFPKFHVWDYPFFNIQHSVNSPLIWDVPSLKWWARREVGVLGAMLMTSDSMASKVQRSHCIFLDVIALVYPSPTWLIFWKELKVYICFPYVLLSSMGISMEVWPKLQMTCPHGGSSCNGQFLVSPASWPSSTP